MELLPSNVKSHIYITTLFRAQKNTYDINSNVTQDNARTRKLRFKIPIRNITIRRVYKICLNTLTFNLHSQNNNYNATTDVHLVTLGPYLNSKSDVSYPGPLYPSN